MKESQENTVSQAAPLATPTALLESMLLTRAYELKLPKLGFTMVCTSVGQEASSAGVVHALGPEDLILTNHRSAGHLISRGADPGRMLAEVMGKSNVIAIGYSDRDPGTAQRVCEAVIRAYVEYRSRDMSMNDASKFFSSEMARVKGELDGKVEARRRFANGAGVSDLAEERRHLLTRISNLNDRSDQTAAELAEARTGRQRMAELKTRQNLDMPTFTSGFTNDNALVSIKSKMIDQQVRVAQLRERYRDDSQEVVAASATLDTLRVMMEREVDSRIAMWDSRIEVLESRQKVFDAEQAEMRNRLDPMADKESQLSTLDRDISLLKARYEDLVRRSDQARLTDKTSVNLNLVLLSPAGPATPQNSRDYARLALAPAFSLVVGLGLAFFFDGIDVTVHSTGQAEEAAELPVLAAIRERRRKAQQEQQDRPGNQIRIPVVIEALSAIVGKSNVLTATEDTMAPFCDAIPLWKKNFSSNRPCGVCTYLLVVTRLIVDSCILMSSATWRRISGFRWPMPRSKNSRWRLTMLLATL